MKLYGLKNCDTCRKAVKQLEASGNVVEFVDVRKEPLSAEQFSEFVTAFGVGKLINKKSTTWRQLSAEDRETDPVPLLQANPSLMKRPVIVSDQGLMLGWAKDVQAKFFG